MTRSANPDHQSPCTFAALQPHHRELLEQFDSGPQRRHPWTREVDLMIREHLPQSLALRPPILGAWHDEDLCGLVAYREEHDVERTWRVNILAVRVGRRTRGIGLALKQELCHLARADGIRVIVSHVHRDNTAMLKINERLGARIVPDPEDAYREYTLCFIRP